MSKTETLRQSAAQMNAMRLERLASQIESMRQAKHQSAEELATTLEPLAQAMAALADETWQTLAEIERRSQQQAENFQQQIGRATSAWIDATERANQAVNSLNRAGQRIEWQHYGLAVLTGMATAALVTAFWLWLAPPKIQNLLDSREVAEWLKPALTGQPPLSSGKQRR